VNHFVELAVKKYQIKLPEYDPLGLRHVVETYSLNTNW